MAQAKFFTCMNAYRWHCGEQHQQIQTAAAHAREHNGRHGLHSECLLRAVMAVSAAGDLHFTNEEGECLAPVIDDEGFLTPFRGRKCEP